MSYTNQYLYLLSSVGLVSRLVGRSMRPNRDWSITGWHHTHLKWFDATVNGAAATAACAVAMQTACALLIIAHVIEDHVECKWNEWLLCVMTHQPFAPFRRLFANRSASNVKCLIIYAYKIDVWHLICGTSNKRVCHTYTIHIHIKHNFEAQCTQLVWLCVGAGQQVGVSSSRNTNMYNIV